MRIIGGEFGGRILTTPRDERTRPMLEQTRAAVFNMLGDAVEGARVLDLYSGTGSLGLEALSRGAVFARFTERDRVALQCLEENIQNLGVGDICNINKLPVARAVAGETEIYQLIFLDPPYPEIVDGAKKRDMLAMVRDLHSRVLAPGGTLVFHFPTHHLREADFAGMPLHRLREYGRNSVAVIAKSVDGGRGDAGPAEN